MPIGSQKALKPKPPDKGSFPLDHDGTLVEPLETYHWPLFGHRRVQGSHDEVLVMSEGEG